MQLKLRSYAALLLTLVIAPCVRAQATDSIRFVCGELLCRPTATAVSINACTNRAADVYYEYGTDSVTYTGQTSVTRAVDSIPFLVTITGLQPNTRYYYRMRFRAPNAALYAARPARRFTTKRAAGATFTFAIEADPHMDTNSLATVYNLTLQNMLSANPDFLIDLGDTFMGEKQPIINQQTLLARHLLLRSFFDIACHSTPLFLVQGNHDGELGWRLDTSANNMPVWQTNIRKQYYPNPVPDGFYSGNSRPEPYVGLRENYYAWEWGNALFIVLDPYWYTKTKPGWGWTLGADQYNWLRGVLATSTADFKFVFSHQLVGGNGNDARGGTEFADLFEWGGKNADSTWGFSNYRAGWQNPIHKLLVDYHVNVFFHGHDHFYGKQDKDGVVYQEVPQPSLKNYQTTSAASYGYVNGVILPNRGYLLVTITDTFAKVEYIRTYLPSEENASRHNKDVSHTYTLLPGALTASKDYLPAPVNFSLSQNYPNPFNPETTIEYHLAEAGMVTVTVYDALGTTRAVLEHSYQQAGVHSILFSPATCKLSSGVYYYRLQSGGSSSVRKMIYIK